MSGERKTNPSDPTAEGTADQSTQTAGGLTGGRDNARGATPGGGREGSKDNRDQHDDDDPALPSGDASLKTTI